MFWLYLIAFSVLLYSIAIILQRVLLKDDKIDPIAYSIFFQFIAGFLIGAYGFILGGMTFSNMKPLIFNIILMILLWSFSNIFSFKALKTIEASEYTIIFTSRTLFTVITSAIFLGNILTHKQILGGLLIIIATVLAVYKNTKFKFKIGELYALLGAMAFGFETTNDKIILSSFKLYPYVTIAYLFPALFMLFLFPKSILRMKDILNKKRIFKVLLFCGLLAISSLAFFSALQIATNASQVVILNQVTTIVIVLMGIIFLKERDNMPRKLLAAILSVVGVILTI